MVDAALLLLADGRLPIGGHVHSGGIEAAWDDGRVRDLDDAAEFVLGRLATTGLVEAALTAALVVRLAAGPPGADEGGAPVAAVVGEVDAHADARLPVEVQRGASRRLGRQLTRVAGGWWPSPAVEAARAVHPDGPHQVTALGAVASAAGAGARDAALLSLHHHVATPLQAVVKLGGLDPFAAAGVQARLGARLGSLADAAARAGHGALDDLPSASPPLVEVAAVAHGLRSDRLFAT